MRIYLLIMTIVATVIIIDTAMALPEMLDSFDTKYNTKGTRLDTCDVCHIPNKPHRSACDEVCHIPNKPQKVDPINLNPYGMGLRAHLDIPVDQALATIESLDSDADKFTNIDEIHNLTFPGSKNDFPKKRNLVSNSLNILEYFKFFNFLKN